MKHHFTFLVMLPLLLLSGNATGQAERTFVKSFNTLGKQQITVNLGDNVIVNPYDGDLIRVQMTVTLPTTNDATLKALVEIGRYTLKTEEKDATLTIVAPTLNNALKINGNPVREVIHVVVFVPKHLTVVKNTDSAAKIVAKLEP
jgi:hypothetical protein